MKKTFFGMIAAAFFLAAATAGFAADLPMGAFSAPVGMLELADGSLLVAEWGADRVSKVDDSGKRSAISGISAPAGLAMDDHGNIYIAGYGDGNVYVWKGSGEPEVIARGFRQPTGLLWNRGSLLVANRGAGTIEEIGEGGGKRIVSSGHSLPVGIAISGDGGMYVSCYGGTVDRVDKDGSIRKIGKGFGTPGVGILPWGADTVLVVDNSAGKVVEAGVNGVVKTLAENLPSPVGLVRTSGNGIVVSTWGDGKIRSLRMKNE